jgi:hypothetical protein
MLLAVDNFEQAKVASVVRRQCVGLVDDLEADPGKRIFNLLK